jgi:propionyl-CoA synthetase
VFDGSNAPFNRWFPGGELNTCYNAVDRHVEVGNGGKTAFIYDSPVTNTISSLTYNQLKERVTKVAGLLTSLGVKKGDTVVIYMPMIPEALISMLACARLGAIHSVVFGGFAAAELSIRLKDCKPKVVLTASCGIEGHRVIQYKPFVDQAIALASSTHQVHKVVVLQRPQHPCELISGRDLDWAESEAQAAPFMNCVPVKSEDPLYILYTSGTTGAPKGILRDNGGHAVALNWAMKNIFDINSGDVWWSASDVGWVVGHSFCVYGPLFAGCTTLFYEGKPVGTPDAGSFWRVIQQHKVAGLFTAPTAIRAIKREDAAGDLPKEYDLSSLRGIFLAGERADPSSIQWAERNLKVPVIDNWWQTETGWPICGEFLSVSLAPIDVSP